MHAPERRAALAATGAGPAHAAGRSHWGPQLTDQPSRTGTIRADVIVVGAGGSGAVVAARLSENPDRRVLVVESGAAWSEDATEQGRLLRDASSLEGSVDPRTSWTYPAELTRGRPWGLARGRGVGGSTAVNAGYFVRASPDDLALWESTLGWKKSTVREAYRRSETDLDHLGEAGHGSSGPIQVRRPPQDDAITQAIRRAATAHGLADVPDVNAPTPAFGIGALPRNVTDGRRWDTGRAYLLPVRRRPNLQIVTGAHAVRLNLDVVTGRTPRISGVTVRRDGRLQTYEASEVVLCAGAIGSAHLLLLSGIGPAGDLELLDRVAVVDLPVGRSTSDHPQISVPWTPHVITETPDPVRSVIHVGDLELLPLLTPTATLLDRGRRTADPVLELLVADQAPEARGELELDPQDPTGPPVIRSRYLESPRDRGTLRSGVRLAASLLREAAGDEGGLVDGPTPADLDSDIALDAWGHSHLGTALHLSGTAPAGPPSDPGAVVDPRGRVLGVEGLRIADLSVLPRVPSRGPAATAVMLGELLAEHDA